MDISSTTIDQISLVYFMFFTHKNWIFGSCVQQQIHICMFKKNECIIYCPLRHAHWVHFIWTLAKWSVLKCSLGDKQRVCVQGLFMSMLSLFLSRAFYSFLLCRDEILTCMIFWIKRRLLTHSSIIISKSPHSSH